MILHRATRRLFPWLLAPLLAVVHAADLGAAGPSRVQVESGMLEGSARSASGIRVFRGIPFAAPPVGELRWRAPKPVPPWTGVRKAVEFGARCMQATPLDGVAFRDAGESEDCLFLNVWTPAKDATEKLPVFVWIHGGALAAGSASEARYDGEALARKGLVVVSLNYRLGALGFFAHPDLTRESGVGASGNYGWLDQVAALQWVQKNIAAFGGDPGKVTIAGESAGSLSVCVLMAAPPAQGLFARAIGESGAVFFDGAPGAALISLADAESAGAKFVKAAGKSSLAELRAAPAAAVLQAAKDKSFVAGGIVDGYVLPISSDRLYAQGKQAHVPLLAGWNADEGSVLVVANRDKFTAGAFKVLAALRFGFHTGDFLKLYPATSDDEAYHSAEQLAGDDWTAYATWKWLNIQAQTAKVPVYRYYFEHHPLVKPGELIFHAQPGDVGSFHSAELEYVFQTLGWREVPVPANDARLAEAMSTYWANFARTGDPNGGGLPAWPPYDAAAGYPLMHLTGQGLRALPEDTRPRYEFLEARGPTLK
jgi:para-nitrobenzyl esterase